MYFNLKLVEEFEADLNKLIMTEADDDTALGKLDNKNNDMDQELNFSVEDEDEVAQGPDESIDDESYEKSHGIEPIKESKSLASIIEEIEDELDEDDEEDFNGDGIDDIDPEELDKLNLGVGDDEEIQELSDEELIDEAESKQLNEESENILKEMSDLALDLEENSDLEETVVKEDVEEDFSIDSILEEINLLKLDEGENE